VQKVRRSRKVQFRISASLFVAERRRNSAEINLFLDGQPDGEDEHKVAELAVRV